MALFLVAAVGSSGPTIDSVIPTKIASTEAYKIENGKWIVDVTGISTSKDLSEFLGFSATVTHFIVPVRGYFGRAQPDLWEWLAAKTSKANA